MCVLFVVGVMNLLWVALLTAFVLVEKIGPAGPLVARAGGVAMLLAGIAVAVFGPEVAAGLKPRPTRPPIARASTARRALRRRSPTPGRPGLAAAAH